MVMLLGALPMNAVQAQAAEVEEVTEAPAVEEVPVEEETPAVEEEVPVVEEEAPAVEEEVSAVEEEVPAVEEEAPAVEETVSQDTVFVGHATGTYDVELSSNEEQFAGYVQQMFYGQGSASGSASANYGTAAGKKLSGDEKTLYNAIASMFKKVASGKQKYAVVSIGETISIGGETITPDVAADLSYYTDSSGYVRQSDEEAIHNMFIALLSDLPYEQYWHDKTTGYAYSWYYNGAGEILLMEFYFEVADNYEADKPAYVDLGGGTYYYIEADTVKTGAAAKAAANAKDIVSDYASKSDYDKLLAYKNKICKLVEYDYDAVNYGDFAWDDDPWQLIHVFDGDSSTNVVCEGYSKAFMYLCDLSDFSGKVTCYTVSGDAGGAHMWNIVTIGGANYLVDVTNSESGYIGQDGSLFLAGASGSIANGYTFNTSPKVTFTYNSETKKLWGTGSGSILKLASSNYDPAKSLEAPTVKVSNVASTGKIKLTWNKVEGASKYKVYRSTKESSGYSLLSTTTGTSLTNSSAVVGTQYYYYVVAVNANGDTSAKSNKVTRVCDLPRPELKIAVVASTGKLKLTWDAVEGATKYQVYRSTDGGESYSLLKTTTGTSLTNTSITAGNKYYYKVKAIHSNSNANSAYSSVKSGTCDLPRPTVKIAVVSSTGKLKLTWEKVEGATKYEVYRSTDGGESYSLLKSTTGTSLTNTSITAGNKYYYKVKAIHSNENANSAYSNVRTGTCDLPRPTATVKLNSSGKPVVSWEKVEGAVKYTVYIYDADGELLKTSSTTGLKLTHSSATKGATYKYRVVAVHSNTAANSAKSTTVSIKSK